ncbi:16S rRNA (guanine(966)-N(2))-methyltransferase RsmD [Salsuginibacillus halophilus]|uniref:16S rRNA (Guanine(966)-N(2))-methyltransferase RsmD n=1 Tax=Salsuginibacillus halophilus TaxID=517424 RepID=A0A2P8HX25_9BACI|nr:16S rRNA (guanine(966)-N(2))-methyltransferase RsmD [Salsuginibacillus halophilus]PSL50791.1 16S rRNA (guanine(966)-N(2))-methyltransferase RsmD [Salsuginibacillus halophilus]
MRVIAGKHKGMKLQAPSGSTTRPTSDRVKEALFQKIGPYFENGICLDLYAGSGGLGIEALSRGMNCCVFVEKNKRSAKVVEENIQKAGLMENSEVMRFDAKAALTRLFDREEAFELVFLDPPYADQQLAMDLQLLQSYQLLQNGAFIVCEHDSSVTPPEEEQNMAVIYEKSYGQTAVTIYEYDEEDPGKDGHVL